MQRFGNHLQQGTPRITRSKTAPLPASPSASLASASFDGSVLGDAVSTASECVRVRNGCSLLIVYPGLFRGLCPTLSTSLLACR